MFCSKCGGSVEDTAAFCSACGNQLTAEPVKSKSGKTVSLMGFQMRVPYGSVKPEDVLQMGDEPFEFPASSEEAKRANTPFDASKTPEEGDLVPLDCAWAFFKHPGEFPKNPNNFGSIDKKFVAMGTLPGRTFSEIVSVVGNPMTNMANGDVRACVWGKTGLFSMWQIGLRFDKYGICMGIFSETNI